MSAPTTRYANSEGVHIAYQVFGSGPVDIILVPGFVSHIDNYWSHPDFTRWLERLGSFGRVVMFDKRGTGMSDRVGELPSMDDRMDDVRAVMSAAGIDTAAVFGVSEGGSLATLFAAHHPDRCDALIVYGGFARFSQWLSEEQLEELFEYADTSWGTGESLPMFAPSYSDDVALKEWWGRFERLGADPGSAIKLMQMNREIDISGVLNSVHVPTLIIHRKDETTIDFAGAEMLAEGIPDAKLVVLDGVDHLPFVGHNATQIVDEIQHFLTGTRAEGESNRVLATVLFTDIVDSTSIAEQMGDTKWRSLMHAHESSVREQLERFRGNMVKTTGDGILATFDAPARAIRCALAITADLRRLGLEIRAGLHTGEIHTMNGDVEGISVHIASRVAGAAAANEVLVSRTVRDLVAGSGISLEPRGAFELKGISDDWTLYRAHL